MEKNKGFSHRNIIAARSAIFTRLCRMKILKIFRFQYRYCKGFGNQKAPVNVLEEEFISKTLDIKTFRKKAVSSQGIVIDLRDPIQIKENLPGFEKALPVPVDKFVRNIISKEHMKDKKLFIFDQVGGQTKWVMYYLVDKDYTDFYFLNGGATSVLKEQEYKVAFAQ